jgi:hypothetical protein
VQVLSAEFGETVTFRTTDAEDFIRRFVQGGVPPGQAELLCSA